MREIKLTIDPDSQSVKVAIVFADGMYTERRFPDSNIVFAVAEALEFIQETNREYCVTCYALGWVADTGGMCADCWKAEVQRFEND